MKLRIDTYLVATVLRAILPFTDSDVVTLEVTLRKGEDAQAIAAAIQAGALSAIPKRE